jgi:hypothetical protein
MTISDWESERAVACPKEMSSVTSAPELCRTAVAAAPSRKARALLSRAEDQARSIQAENASPKPCPVRRIP